MVMFIRKIKNSSGQTYYHLVESYREGRKVRQRTLMSLGKAGDGNLDKLLKATSRYQDAATIADLAKEISVDQTYILGPLLVLKRLFEDLGVNKTLDRILGRSSQAKNRSQKNCFHDCCKPFYATWIKA